MRVEDRISKGNAQNTSKSMFIFWVDRDALETRESVAIRLGILFENSSIAFVRTLF